MNEQVDSIFDLAPDNFDLEIYDPNGTATGMIFRLRPESSAEVQAVEKRYQAQLVNAFRRNQDATQILDRKVLDKRLAAVAGVRFESGDSFKFMGRSVAAFDPTAEVLRRIFSGHQYAWLTTQVDDALTDTSAGFR